jgi:chromosome segregation ATPase
MPSDKANPGVPTADEVPVTRGMLSGVRTEFLQRLDQGREEAKAEKQELDGTIDAVRAELKVDIQKVDAKLDAVRVELHEVRADIHRLDASIHEMKAGMARIEVLVEEQNARNRIVLDGITALLSRQNQVEQRVVQVEDTVRELAATPRAG